MDKTANASCDILLVGHPNVGKSVLFSRLTGIHTIASNYPGTTVGYATGKLRHGDKVYRLVDAPGTYYLEPFDVAAKVTLDLLDDAGHIINVVDATHLERHLPLTLELLAQGKPMVVALNMSDEARHKGISIDCSKLSDRLGVPVIPCVARTGEGVKNLVGAALAVPQREPAAADPPGHPGRHLHIPRHDTEENGKDHAHLDRQETWHEVGEIVREVQTLRHHHHTVAEWLEDVSVHPLLGMVVAVLVLGLSFALVRLAGEFLIAGDVGIFGEPWFTVPFGSELLFDKLWKPVMMALSSYLGESSFLHRILLGDLIDGDIDFMEGFGLLTSGLFISLGVVLPYVVSFYFVLSILEDTGYLPRLAVFLDNLMHCVGLHGYAVIPNLLGLGCNVPGILATRILETRAQRFIAATLISIAVPCAALQGMIIQLLGKRGIGAVLVVYAVLFASWFVIGIVLRLTAGRGFQPELLLEIPPYRVPDWRNFSRKMWMRILGFLKEALVLVLVAVFIVNILYQLRLFDAIAGLFSPVVCGLWGMPKEAIVPLLVGILRKYVGVGMFVPLALTTKQLIIGCVALSMFFPCVATFAVLYRELGIKDGLKSTAVMLISVVAVCTALNLLL